MQDCAFSLLLLRELEDCVRMLCRFVEDPEDDVADEEVDDGGFGDDILAADADGVDVLLLNVGQHHAAAVTDDLCRGLERSKNMHYFLWGTGVYRKFLTEPIF